MEEMYLKKKKKIVRRILFLNRGSTINKKFKAEINQKITGPKTPSRTMWWSVISCIVGLIGRDNGD